MSITNRQILASLIKELNANLGESFHDSITAGLSRRSLEEQLSAPSTDCLLTVLSNSLQHVDDGITTRKVWNREVAAYHRALTSAMAVIDNFGRQAVARKANTDALDNRPVTSNGDKTSLGSSSRQGVTPFSSPIGSSYSDKVKGSVSTGKKNSTSATKERQALESKQQSSSAMGPFPHQKTENYKTLEVPPRTAFTEALCVWENPPVTGCYSRTPHVKCTSSRCQFCRALVLNLVITKCSEHPGIHRDGPCTKSGWFPHVGKPLWGQIKGVHKRGEPYRTPDQPVKFSLAWFQTGDYPLSDLSRLTLGSPSSPKRSKSKQGGRSPGSSIRRSESQSTLCSVSTTNEEDLSRSSTPMPQNNLDYERSDWSLDVDE